jgi:hypothetical protein
MFVLSQVFSHLMLIRQDTFQIYRGSVADSDPGSGAFLPLDSGLVYYGSRIPYPQPIFLRALG